ncbi:MAG: tetraacyldisaccharide 4'-kinase [Thermodesulfovibrionales bacterium]|nr:tetraacyldisaccharide 4'-kinase [Thermodesulfovibrionales bacterium]
MKLKSMTPFEALYYIGYSLKKYHALKNQKRLPCRVISIGNITVGGTGKTPATIVIAEEAKKRGFIPTILTRGYKGKTKGPYLVSKGDGPLLSEKEAGDEPMLMAERLKGVPVVKGKNRYEAGIFAIENLKSQISNLKFQVLFILDDGFQHWDLFRDKDILLIDSTNPFGNRRLIPLGPLREPLSAISRADIIVITRTDNSVRSHPPQAESGVKGLIEEIRQHNTRAPIFSAEHRPSKFITATGGALPLEWAKGKGFFGFSGIGNPESFKKSLLSAGVDLRGFKSYRDHYRYNSEDIEKIIKSAEKSDANWIVTTEKDIMRLKGLNIPVNLIALSIEFTVGEGFYNEVFDF